MTDILAINRNIRIVSGLDDTEITRHNRATTLRQYQCGKAVILNDGECLSDGLGKAACYACQDLVGEPMCERYQALKNDTIKVNE